jgi:hypothetical protein
MHRRTFDQPKGASKIDVIRCITKQHSQLALADDGRAAPM